MESVRSAGDRVHAYLAQCHHPAIVNACIHIIGADRQQLGSPLIHCHTFCLGVWSNMMLQIDQLYFIVFVACVLFAYIELTANIHIQLNSMKLTSPK